MIFRSRRITFRLTHSEADKYEALLKRLPYEDMSALVRRALLELWDRENAKRPITMSDTRSHVRQADRLPLFATAKRKKTTKRVKTLGKKR